jgi:integrase
MVPRKASLRVAHQRTCPNVSRSALDSFGAHSGCTCKPVYYTFHRDRSGKSVKGPRVTDRRVAEQALRKLQVGIDEGRVGAQREVIDETTFREWADMYLGIVADNRRKQSTIRAYEGTIAYAEEAFGGRLLSEIGNPELREFAKLIRDNEAGGSDATLGKHLRQLSTIFETAAEDELIDRNPVPKFRKGLRLKIPSGDETYTDAELESLWAAMGELKYKPVYVAICKAAVTTGARVGELIAAEWGNLDLTQGKLRIEHTYSPEDGLTLPKENEPRTLHLIPPAVRVFEESIKVCGVKPDDAPIFESVHGGRIGGDSLARMVDKARRKVGIPDVGENGRRRKPFHAFRACFARLCHQAGLNPQWVQAQLGHSDPHLTLNVYGKWSDAGLANEASKIDADAFPI